MGDLTGHRLIIYTPEAEISTPCSSGRYRAPPESRYVATDRRRTSDSTHPHDWYDPVTFKWDITDIVGVRGLGAYQQASLPPLIACLHLSDMQKELVLSSRKFESKHSSELQEFDGPQVLRQ